METVIAWTCGFACGYLTIRAIRSFQTTAACIALLLGGTQAAFGYAVDFTLINNPGTGTNYFSINVCGQNVGWFDGTHHDMLRQLPSGTTTMMAWDNPCNATNGAVVITSESGLLGGSGSIWGQWGPAGFHYRCTDITIGNNAPPTNSFQKCFTNERTDGQCEMYQLRNTNGFRSAGVMVCPGQTQCITIQDAGNKTGWTIEKPAIGAPVDYVIDTNNPAILHPDWDDSNTVTNIPPTSTNWVTSGTPPPSTSTSGTTGTSTGVPNTNNIRDGNNSNAATEGTLKAGMEAVVEQLRQNGNGEAERDRNMQADFDKSMDYVKGDLDNIADNTYNLRSDIQGLNTNLVAIRNNTYSFYTNWVDGNGTNLSYLPKIHGDLTNTLGDLAHSTNYTDPNNLQGSVNAAIGTSTNSYRSGEQGLWTAPNMPTSFTSDNPGASSSAPMNFPITFGTITHTLSLDSNAYMGRIHAVAPWVKRWLGYMLAFTVFWIIYKDIQFSRLLILHSSLSVKMMGGWTVGGALAKASLSIFIFTGLSALVASFPTSTMAFVAGGGYTAWFPSFAVDLATNGVNGAGTDATKAAIAFFNIFGEWFPFAVFFTAIANLILWNYTHDFVLGLTYAMLRAIGIAVGVFVLCLFPLRTDATEVNLENLTGNFLTISNDHELLTIPPGLHSLNLEPTRWDFGPSNSCTIPTTQGKIGLRFEAQTFPGVEPDTNTYTLLKLEMTEADSSITTFLHGLYTGWAVFGFAWMVASVRKSITLYREV